MDDDPISGWGLRPVELADKSLFGRYFQTLAEPLSDYTFAQLFTWRNSLRILWRESHGHLCVFANGAGDLTLLMPPIGDTGSAAALADAFALMDDYNAAHGVPHRSRVEYASDELLRRIGRDAVDVRPMGADYVYDVRRMIDLAGGDLASKRQAKNRFVRNYAHIVKNYDAFAHKDDCVRLLDLWKATQDTHHAADCDASTAAVKRSKETLATVLCLESADQLGLRGLVVYVQEPHDPQPRLRGFTFGEPLGRDQSSITIEKTDLAVKGLAQFIFSEFCRTAWADRPLVNVGDDWGLETLAWTKMSYRPVKMLHKYVVRKTATSAVGYVPAPDPEPAAVTEADPAPAIAPYVVRPACKADLAAAVDLERTCFGDGSFSLTKRQVHYLQKRPTAVFLVAERDGVVVGQGVALVRQHKSGPTGRTASGRIYSLAVHPDARGQGIGEALLRSMIDTLASRGVRRIYLEVESTNAAAGKLYDRVGFKPVDTLPNYYGPGRPATHMVLDAAATAVAA